MDALSLTHAFLYYVIGVNALVLVLSCYDKLAAMNFWPRVSERFLLWISLAGGAPAAKFVQLVTGYKSLRMDFTVNLTLIIVLQIGVGVAAWSIQSPLLKELDLTDVKPTASAPEKAEVKELPRRFGPGS
ncbi:MAG: DUF1294 domain-containing protein [Boseongicola sp.]|nr:DUF1294 domain-containing protein [Boseongicola sp.]MDD9978899.1 DUF1294 domain-containing protein [Boseongicola sp.]